MLTGRILSCVIKEFQTLFVISNKNFYEKPFHQANKKKKKIQNFA